MNADCECGHAFESHCNAAVMQGCYECECGGYRSTAPASGGAEGFGNLRGIPEVFALIGTQLVEVTHDADGAEWKVCLHFSNGTTLVFPIGPEGFDVSPI